MRAFSATGNGPTGGEVVSHFWGIQSSFISTSIIAAPYRGPVTDDDGELPRRETITAEIYDVDGALTNSVTLEFPHSETGILELAPLMGGCKISHGLQQCHVVLKSGSETRCAVRYQSLTDSFVAAELLAVRPREPSFVPLAISNLKEQVMALVNCQTEPAQLNCRMYYGTRTPELNVVIPPLGVKLVSIDADLLEAQDIRVPPNEVVQSYLRFHLKNSGLLGVQILERGFESGADQEIYRALA